MIHAPFCICLSLEAAENTIKYACKKQRYGPIPLPDPMKQADKPRILTILPSSRYHKKRTHDSISIESEYGSQGSLIETEV